MRERLLMTIFDPIREVREITNQLSYSKSYGFFFGAGTSCALGIPDIATLTTDVQSKLEGEDQKNFDLLKADLETTFPNTAINIEQILSQVRQIRSITGEKAEKKYLSVNGAQAKNLDNSICNIIYGVICAKESTADLTNTKKFLAWFNMQNANNSKEIFTTNYDLIIEKSLDEMRMPYFDGFVGSYEPFFWQESIERFPYKSDLTHNWFRVWKIHGSLNWFWKKNSTTKSDSIVRGLKISDIETLDNELVIYPSKEKYDSSKKQPFVAYFDRLKRVLTRGELLFIFSGYSFSDQHINEIIFSALQQNTRLTVLVFCYRDEEVEALYADCSSYLNLSAFGPTKAIINGTLGNWEIDESDQDNLQISQTYWDASDNKMILGDFQKLVDFLIANSGRKEHIETLANG